jgi:hypothetical protein
MIGRWFWTIFGGCSSFSLGFFCFERKKGGMQAKAALLLIAFVVSVAGETFPLFLDPVATEIILETPNQLLLRQSLPIHKNNGSRKKLKLLSCAPKKKTDPKELTEGFWRWLLQFRSWCWSEVELEMMTQRNG